MTNLSLNTRMALAISAVFITFVSLISYGTLSYFETEFRNTLAKEQYSLVSTIAANIEDKMTMAQNILIASAKTIPPSAIKDPDAAQRFLDAQKGLHYLFDNGIFLISKDGILISESPYLSRRRGLDFTFRDYYQQTVKTRKPYISQPYLATHHPGEPAIAMTVPIVDNRGEITAILQGSFLLLKKNFIADLLNVRNGQTGYLYLSDRNRVIIFGPFKDRILKPGLARGSNIMLDKAVEGFEGSGETVTSFGVKMFVTFTHVNPTGWILGSNYPMAEAYAPFYKARSYFIVGIITTTGLVLIIVWGLMTRFTKPLLAIIRHVKTLPSNLGNYQVLGIDTNDEIGDLATAFDSMATSLAVKESELQGSELNFRALAENANDGMLIVDVDGAIVYVNGQIAEVTGYDTSELLALNIRQIIAPESLHVIDAIHAAVFVGQVTGICEITLIGKDQSRIPVEVSNAQTIWSGTSVDLLVIRDIRERRRAEKALQESQERLDIAVRSAGMGVWSFDIASDKRYFDDQTCRLFGIDPATFTGSAEEFFQTVHPDDREMLKATLAHSIEKNIPYDLEYRVVWPDGSIRYIAARGRLVRDELGRPLLINGIAFDVSEWKEAQDQIHNLAFYDPLTGLPNRRLLSDRIQQALTSSERNGLTGAILFIDLDNFKTINDTLGHALGDSLLQQAAARLTSCVRDEDTVSRLGGDEFVVMLEYLSDEGPVAAAQTESIGEKILVALSQPYQIGSHEYRSTCSIGITLFNDRLQATDELLKQADIAMYQAKKAGRNVLRFFDPQMQEIVTSRAAMEAELRKALENRQFQLYYQIQVDSFMQPIGAEALIRWAHPERGLVSPLEFIPLAEETGLILPIGQWILDTACAQLKAWRQQDQTRNLVLAVNVSARELRQADFVAHVQDTVQRHAINPTMLKLELTESALLEDIEDTVAIMNALNDIGVQFSLDDFGTGYSSLQYLKRLPLDQIKIDQSFVRDLPINSGDRAIVRTIIAMAASLNLDVIAEGVETGEQLQILLNKGCTHYQGYLFGRPEPIEQFDAHLKDGQKRG